MLSRRILTRVNLLKTLTRSASTPSVPKSDVISPSQANAPVAPQAPNYPTTWSTNQRSRPTATTGPRFEQTVMEFQPNPLSAMEMIANEPVRIVHGRKAVCDGGAFLLHLWDEKNNNNSKLIFWPSYIRNHIFLNTPR